MGYMGVLTDGIVQSSVDVLFVLDCILFIRRPALCGS